MSLEANWQEEKKSHKVGDNPVASKDPGQIYKLYEELDGKGQFSFMRSPPCDGDPLDPFPFGWGFSRLDGIVKGEGANQRLGHNLTFHPVVPVSLVLKGFPLLILVKICSKGCIFFGRGCFLLGEW